MKGTFDVLPDTGTSRDSDIPGSAQWLDAEARIREVMRRFNVREIRTPIFEPTGLIARGIGALTDVVSKEMFAFEREGVDYVLRPENTAPVMRAYLQHNLAQIGGVQKLSYIGPFFRAEQPQKGRYRQFHQFGAEYIGSEDPRSDAEMIALMMAVYEAFGITGMRLRLNTLGSPDSRAAYRDALRQYFAPHVGALTETSRQRLDKNPLRLLDTKVEHERALVAEAPRLTEFVSEDDHAHYGEVKRLLDGLGIAFVEDPLLVRGLDYYTRTTFELESDKLGAQSALAGGGRYDLLAVEIGAKKPVPAVGFAAGFERLFIALHAEHLADAQYAAPDVALVALGERAADWAFRTAQDLRAAGLAVATDLKGRSMKAQMREANRQNAPLVLIVGDHELDQNEVVLKQMDTGEQRTVADADLIAAIQGI
ncbi:MAG: histidine--tRNA ligase [Bacteroidota bacterium]